MMNRWISVLAFVALPAALSLRASPYNIDMLQGPPGSTLDMPYGFSSAGAVGQSFIGDWDQGVGSFQPTFWQGATGTILPVPVGYGGRATAINGSGDVAGFVWNNGTNEPQPAFWHNGQVQILTTATMPGGNAYAINSEGVVVGSINNLQGEVAQALAASWSSGQLTILGSFPDAQASALSVNDSGQAVVVAAYSDHSETWVWTNGSLTQITSLGGRVLAGQDINNNGVVVGAATTADGSNVGFVWKDGVTTQLPGLDGSTNSFAWAINNSGEIVGGASDALGNPHAFLWQDGSVFDLNGLLPANSGWVLNQAMDVADDGTIVGYGTFNGQTSAFELTPSASPSGTTPTPEPATAATLLLAAPLLLRRRRRSV